MTEAVAAARMVNLTELTGAVGAAAPCVELSRSLATNTHHHSRTLWEIG